MSVSVALTSSTQSSLDRILTRRCYVSNSRRIVLLKYHIALSDRFPLALVCTTDVRCSRQVGSALGLRCIQLRLLELLLNAASRGCRHPVLRTAQVKVHRVSRDCPNASLQDLMVHGKTQVVRMKHCPVRWRRWHHAQSTQHGGRKGKSHVTLALNQMSSSARGLA